MVVGAKVVPLQCKTEEARCPSRGLLLINLCYPEAAIRLIITLWDAAFLAEGQVNKDTR